MYSPVEIKATWFPLSEALKCIHSTCLHFGYNDLEMKLHSFHYVPSIVNWSDVVNLHRSRSCVTMLQSLYDIFVHSLLLSVHIVLGLPRPLLPFILPTISNRCTPSPLIIRPKYWHFLFLILFNINLLLFILCKTSISFVFFPWYS